MPLHIRCPQDVFALIQDTPTGCKVWTGPKHNAGYGQVYYENKKTYVHRFTWAMKHGPIPPKMFVCHRCDNPLCCNVDHMFIGTQAENNSDMYIKNRGMHGEGHYVSSPQSAFSFPSGKHERP